MPLGLTAISSRGSHICEDDSEAIDKAEEGFEGQAVELWCGERFIARLPAKR